MRNLIIKILGADFVKREDALLQRLDEAADKALEYASKYSDAVEEIERLKGGQKYQPKLKSEKDSPEGIFEDIKEISARSEKIDSNLASILCCLIGTIYSNRLPYLAHHTRNFAINELTTETRMK